MGCEIFGQVLTFAQLKKIAIYGRWSIVHRNWLWCFSRLFHLFSFRDCIALLLVLMVLLKTDPLRIYAAIVPKGGHRFY